jgi:hypothetical protein
MIGVCVATVLLCFVPRGGGTVAGAFVASLRLARPKPDTAGVSLTAPLNGGRRLQDMLSAVVADSTIAVRDEPSGSPSSAGAVQQGTEFRPRLIAARADSPSISILGEQRIEAFVDPDQLHTLLVQAGNPNAVVPRSLAHATVSFGESRGVRVQYGNCPAPVANTLQGQIQGPPPPSSDNANCVAVNEIPVAAVVVPSGLDTAAVMELALELVGMSPKQARDFRRLFPWPAAAVISPPRGIRSYELVRVGDADAMLVITGGRRGPTYALVWTRDGVVYTLTGYGSSADAVTLATSLK